MIIMIRRPTLRPTTVKPALNPTTLDGITAPDGEFSRPANAHHDVDDVDTSKSTIQVKVEGPMAHSDAGSTPANSSLIITTPPPEQLQSPTTPVHSKLQAPMQSPDDKHNAQAHQDVDTVSAVISSSPELNPDNMAVISDSNNTGQITVPSYVASVKKVSPTASDDGLQHTLTRDDINLDETLLAGDEDPEFRA